MAASRERLQLTDAMPKQRSWLDRSDRSQKHTVTFAKSPAVDMVRKLPSQLLCDFIWLHLNF